MSIGTALSTGSVRHKGEESLFFVHEGARRAAKNTFFCPRRTRRGARAPGDEGLEGRVEGLYER